MIINPKSLSRLIAVQVMYMVIIKEKFDYSEILEETFYLYDNHLFHHEYEELLQINNTLKYKKNFIKNIVSCTCTNFKLITSDIINMLHRDDSIDNISIIIQSILLIAFAELKYFTETPWKVIANDYTNIASDFLNEKEVGLVNSILHKYYLQHIHNAEIIKHE